MKYLKSAGLSALLTAIILCSGYLGYKSNGPDRANVSKIEQEFVDIYSQNNTGTIVSSPRGALIEDLKQLYTNPSQEVSEKLKFPDKSYPLLDNEMKDFVFDTVPTGKVYESQNVYTCRYTGSTLMLGNSKVSQEDYRIKDRISSDFSGYDVTCVQLIKEMQPVITSSVPSLLAKIQNGLVVSSSSKQALNQGIIATLFTDYSSFIGWLKIPILFGLLFTIFCFLFEPIAYAASQVKFFGKNKSGRQLAGSEPTPISFLDLESSEIQFDQRKGRHRYKNSP